MYLVSAARRYVATKDEDAKAVAADLKFYTSPTVESAEGRSEEFAEVWMRSIRRSQTVAEEMSGHHFDVRLPGRHPPGDLNQQRDRTSQQPGRSRTTANNTRISTPH